MVRLTFILLIMTASFVDAAPSRDIAISEIEVRIPTKKQAKNPFPQAVDIGKKEAFNKMLLGYSRQLIDKKIKDEEIGDLISKVQMLKEIKTKTVYRAKMTYFFNRAKVDAFITARTKHLDVPHILPKTTLLIPVMEQADGKLLLWEDHQPWRKAWSQHIAELPVILPLGDFEDRRLLSAAQVREIDHEKLDQLLKKYHCSTCVFAQANLKTVQDDEENAEFFLKTVGSETEPMSPINLKADTKEALFEQAIEGFQEEIDRIAGVNTHQTENPLMMTAFRVRVPYSNPGEYYKIEDCLKKVSLIKDIETESVALNETKLKLFCFGDKETLGKALAEQALILQEDQNNLTLIRRAEDPVVIAS